MKLSDAEMRRLAAEKNRADYEGSQNLAPYLGWTTPQDTAAMRARDADAIDATRRAAIARELTVLRWLVGLTFLGVLSLVLKAFL
jgi:hypothetical protein